MGEEDSAELDAFWAIADEIGAHRWFGQSWGASPLTPETHIETPTDRRCRSCHKLFVEGDQGVVMPGVTVLWYYHLTCWLAFLG